jgi:hypothetical protein
MRLNIAIALSLAVLTFYAAAQTVHLSEAYSRVKVENGLIIGWNVASEDRQATQVDVYDNNGKLLVTLSPLRLIPEAKRVTIHDVSARPGAFIAVAAVYRKDNSTVPAGSLLCFDFRGEPLTALALAPSRGAQRLTVDSDGNIWTLTGGAGDISPSEAPMIVGYNIAGSVLKELFKRSEFPLHAAETQENGEVGSPALGHTSKDVWFWLPGSTDEVTFRTDGSSVRRSTTGLPGHSKKEIPERLVLTEGGTLLAQIFDEQLSPRTSEVSFFSRPPSAKVWSRFEPPCSGCFLIGADSENTFFLKKDRNGSDIYTARLN